VSATNGDSEGITFFADATIGRSLTGSLIVTQSLPQQIFFASCATDDPPTDTCSGSQPNNNTFSNIAGVGLAPGVQLSDFSAPLGSTFNLTAELSSALAPRIDPPDNGTKFADNSTIDGTLNANWTGDVTVKYTYDPFSTAVPEPLSLYLVLAGLGGIALWRRRR
jgi:hypothetical protein